MKKILSIMSAAAFMCALSVSPVLASMHEGDKKDDGTMKGDTMKEDMKKGEMMKDDMKKGEMMKDEGKKY